MKNNNKYGNQATLVIDYTIAIDQCKLSLRKVKLSTIYYYYNAEIFLESNAVESRDFYRYLLIRRH